MRGCGRYGAAAFRLQAWAQDAGGCSAGPHRRRGSQNALLANVTRLPRPRSRRQLLRLLFPLLRACHVPVRQCEQRSVLCFIVNLRRDK